jgi:hypothetical protein
LRRCCCNPSLGLATKARAWKGAGWKCNSGVTFTLLRLWESVREWTHTLLSGFPLWELEFRCTFKFLKSNLKGQNSLYWKNIIPLESSWNLDVSNGLVWSISVFTTQVMAKTRVGS